MYSLLSSRCERFLQTLPTAENTEHVYPLFFFQYLKTDFYLPLETDDAQAGMKIEPANSPVRRHGQRLAEIEHSLREGECIIRKSMIGDVDVHLIQIGVRFGRNIYEKHGHAAAWVYRL